MNGTPENAGGRRGRRESGPVSAAFVSVAIILVGLALLSDNLGLVQFRQIWTYWPVLLVGLGVVKVIEARGNQGGIIFGGMLVTAGTLLLLGRLDVIHVNAGIIWPLFVIGAGVMALVRTLERQKASLAGEGSESPRDTGLIHLYAIFGGTKRSLSTREFRGGDATSIFGGIDVDLRDAKIAGTRAVFEVNLIFGGLEVKVPPTWDVSMEAFSIFGGVDDRTVHSGAPDAPAFVVKGMVVFGGIGIKN